MNNDTQCEGFCQLYSFTNKNSKAKILALLFLLVKLQYVIQQSRGQA